MGRGVKRVWDDTEKKERETKKKARVTSHDICWCRSVKSLRPADLSAFQMPAARTTKYDAGKLWSFRETHIYKLFFSADFEDVENAPKHAKCITCTEILGPDLLVLKSGRQAHLTKSRKHQDAVKELARLREQQAAEAARRLEPIADAPLALPTQFDTAGIPESMDVDAPPTHSLDDFVYEDGRFWDTEGREILFSAGDPDPKKRDVLLRRERLERGLESLATGLHPMLGVPSNYYEDSDSEEGADDPTISEMVAELQMLGLLCPQVIL